MKKLLLSLTTYLAIGFLAACLFMGCATSIAATKKASYPDLSIRNIENACEPVEHYNFNVMSLPTLVVRFNDCVGVRDLLLVIMPMEGFSNELRVLSQKVIILNYLNYLDEQKSDDGKLRWQAKLVEREQEESDIRKQDTFYYILTSKVIKRKTK
jgi:hypothetical protein